MATKDDILSLNKQTYSYVVLKAISDTNSTASTRLAMHKIMLAIKVMYSV